MFVALLPVDFVQLVPHFWSNASGFDNRVVCRGFTFGARYNDPIKASSSGLPGRSPHVADLRMFRLLKDCGNTLSFILLRQ